MDANAAAFCRLQLMVQQAEVAPRPRTEAEEDRMALEDLILSHEGPEALERYREKWKREGRP